MKVQVVQKIQVNPKEKLQFPMAKIDHPKYFKSFKGVDANTPFYIFNNKGQKRRIYANVTEYGYAFCFIKENGQRQLVNIEGTNAEIFE